MAKTNSGLLEFKDAQKVLIALDDATSEVKKAVVIDADGVETDIAGVQPTGKKEITSTAEVNVANYATAQVVDEDLVAGNIKKDVDILGVVGSYEGGGSSDFSTAEVTVINGSAEGYNINTPFVDTEEESMYTGQFISSGKTKVLNVIQYKGFNMTSILDTTEYADPVPENNVSMSGDVSYDGSTFTVTGDCTITISTPA